MTPPYSSVPLKIGFPCYKVTAKQPIPQLVLNDPSSVQHCCLLCSIRCDLSTHPREAERLKNRASSLAESFKGTLLTVLCCLKVN